MKDDLNFFLKGRWQMLKKRMTTSNILIMEDDPKRLKNGRLLYFFKHLDGLPDRLRYRCDQQLKNYSLFQQKHQVQLVLLGKKTKNDFCFLASNYLMKAPKLIN